MTKTGWRSKTHLVGGCVDGLGDGAGFGDLGDLGFGHGLRIEGGGRRGGDDVSVERRGRVDRGWRRESGESRRAIELDADPPTGPVSRARVRTRV